MVRIALNCVDREFDGLRGHRESGSTNNGDVRRLRSEGAGISQDALAARCSVLGFDIGRGTISHIETGLRGVSDLEMVILSRALRVPLDELVPAPPPAGKGSPPPNC